MFRTRLPIYSEARCVVAEGVKRKRVALGSLLDMLSNDIVILSLALIAKLLTPLHQISCGALTCLLDYPSFKFSQDLLAEESLGQWSKAP